MPIETKLNRIRSIAAYFDKSGSPLGVQQIEIIMRDTDTLAAVVKMNLLAMLDCCGLEGPSLLLSHSDEEHSVGLSEADTIGLSDIIFSLSLIKLNHRYTHLCGKAFYLVVKPLGDVTEQLGRRNTMTPMFGEKVNQLPRILKGRDIAVEIEPVHTFDFQGHVLSDKLGNVGHGLLRNVMVAEDVPPHSAWEKAPASPRRFFYLSV
jgi:hypothetical protein